MSAGSRRDARDPWGGLAGAFSRSAGASRGGPDRVVAGGWARGGGLGGEKTAIYEPGRVTVTSRLLRRPGAFVLVQLRHLTCSGRIRECPAANVTTYSA